MSREQAQVSYISKATAIFNAQTVALRTQLIPYPVTEEAGLGRGRGNELPENEILGPLSAQCFRVIYPK